MTVDELLDLWARWRLKRDDGLGYRASSLNALMAARLACEPRVSEIPYGVDGDGVFWAIDLLVCRMPEIRKQVVLAEYTQKGSQEQKALRCKPPLSRRRFQNQLDLAHKQVLALPCVKSLYISGI